MKKINSNSYGGKLLSTVLACAVFLPVTAYICFRITGLALLGFIAKLLLALGLLALLLFILFLTAELWQDRRMNRACTIGPAKRQPLEGGLYECQTCGSRNVRQWDAHCRVCGVQFINEVIVMEATSKKALSPVSETLYLPLAVRAQEAAHPNPVLSDEKAVEIFKQLDSASVLTSAGGVAAHGILARTCIIDAELREILFWNPEAIVVNLGAGLDTRISRLDNGALRWYDVDLPEVIALRRQFFVPDGRIRFLEGSVLDGSWADEIERTKKSRVVLIAEGLFMYFGEQEVVAALAMLAERFPGADLYFDAVHPYFVGKGTGSVFRWGLRRAKELEQLCPKLRLSQAWSTGRLLKQRQSKGLRVLNLLSSTRNRSQVIHARFL